MIGKITEVLTVEEKNVTFVRGQIADALTSSPGRLANGPEAIIALPLKCKKHSLAAFSPENPGGLLHVKGSLLPINAEKSNQLIRYNFDDQTFCQAVAWK